ncbi:MAG: hypothetical protein U0Q22_01895 [Acidimicrobiales bacterium]
MGTDDRRDVEATVVEQLADGGGRLGTAHARRTDALDRFERVGGVGEIAFEAFELGLVDDELIGRGLRRLHGAAA